jgi:hypothetical protein
MKALATWIALTGAAFVVGFGLAWVVVAGANWVLPPFRYPDDDDTVRDYGPVFLGYAAWGLTTLIGSVLAWRHVRPGR